MIRNYKDNDYTYILDMILHTWDIPDIAGELYLRYILNISEVKFIHEENKKITGILLATTKRYSIKSILKYLFTIISLINSFTSGIIHFSTLKFLLNEISITNKIRRNYNHSYISLILVNQNDKHKGIGSRLVNQFFSFIKVYNKKSVVLWSDQYCDSEFYNSIGFNIVKSFTYNKSEIKVHIKTLCNFSKS